MDSLTLAKTAAGILDAKKADQINVIRISDVSSLGDYFVLANGTGSTHVHALADELEFKLKELGIAIRDCGDFAGLTPAAGKRYYRIGVRTHAENEALRRALLKEKE